MNKRYIKSFNSYILNENESDDKDNIENSQSVKRFNDFLVFVEEIKKKEKPLYSEPIGNGSVKGTKVVA